MGLACDFVSTVAPCVLRSWAWGVLELPGLRLLCRPGLGAASRLSSSRTGLCVWAPSQLVPRDRQPSASSGR